MASSPSGAEPTEPKLVPTSPVERYEILDVVRGFALLGVVVVNWYYTGAPTFLPRDQLLALPTAGIDRVVRMLNELFFDDKFYVGRHALLQRADQHLHLYRHLLPWALLIGLVGNGLHTASVWLRDPPVYLPEAPFPERLLWILVECGIPAMALAYVCALVLIYQTPTGRRLLGALAPLGRMALTNYLTQSLVFVFLFYGVGLGLVGRVGIAVATFLAVTVFLAQIVLSAFWLKRFRFGPAEWAWRCLTYGKWVAIR